MVGAALLTRAEQSNRLLQRPAPIVRRHLPSKHTLKPSAVATCFRIAKAIDAADVHAGSFQPDTCAQDLRDVAENAQSVASALRSSVAEATKAAHLDREAKRLKPAI